MPLPTTTSAPASRCGVCHSSDRADCIRFTSALVLCSSGIPAHEAPATGVVRYVVDHSGRRDFDNGDVEHLELLVCDHPACIAEAERHADVAGQHIETVHLDRAVAEDHSGLDLAAVSA